MMALPSFIVKELSDNMARLEDPGISLAEIIAIERRLDDIQRAFPPPVEKAGVTFQTRLGAFRQRGF